MTPSQTAHTGILPKPPLCLTAGEPAGIGPDLCIALAQHPASSLPPLAVICDSQLLKQRADMLGLPLTILHFRPEDEATCGDGILTIIENPLAEMCIPGQPVKSNAKAVINALDLALEGCHAGRFAGMVTGPVQKSIINDAGLHFTGHTEYLAEKSGADQVVMMLATEALRVALVTTHLPLSQVAAAITPALLTRVIEVLHSDLVSRFHLERPRILVCGLNPHAGEQGYLGREEIEIISPVLDSLRARGVQLTGPLPADTLFTPRHLEQADAVLAMYHDQGLPVLKYQGFGNAVNITLGLPFVRTSVDHGTALDLASTGKADTGSLFAAIAQAAAMTPRGLTA